MLQIFFLNTMISRMTPASTTETSPLTYSHPRCDRSLYCSSMDLSCNIDCGCSLKVFHPVCINGTTFFSPCFAGCATPAEPNSAEEVVGISIVINVAFLYHVSTSSMIIIGSILISGFQGFLNCSCAGYSTSGNLSMASNRDTVGFSLSTVYEGHCKNPADECETQYSQYLCVLTLAYCVSFVFQTARILLPMR